MTGKLIYRGSWTETPPVRPVAQRDVSDPALRLSLHGPGCLGLKKSHHDDIEGDPYYLWSGTCAGRWAASLRHRGLLVDFERGGRVLWCTRQSGANRLRLVIKPAEGSWLISDEATGATDDWQESELRPAALTWRLLDIGKVEVGDAVQAPCLRRVDEVGFADLLPGGGIDACSRLAWIEVRGAAMERPRVIET
jgi:hypothetical protein